MILPWEMIHRHDAKELSNVPKYKKAVMCLREKIRVLGQLRSGISCAVGCGFHVNKSTIYVK